MWSCFRGWFGDILPFQRIKSPMNISIVREFNYSWFISDNRRLQVFRIPRINLFQNHPHKETANKTLQSSKREDPSLGESSNKQPTNQRWTNFFHPPFFKQKNHQPQGSLPPNPAQKPNQAFICWLVGLWRWHIAWSFPKTPWELWIVEIYWKSVAPWGELSFGWCFGSGISPGTQK